MNGRNAKQPNNLRNRYRRYRASRIGYGFTYSTLREWIVGWGHTYQYWQHDNPEDAHNWALPNYTRRTP